MVDIFGFTINIGTQELIFLVAVFVVFLIVVRKVMKTLMTIVWITLASAAFPFIAKFLGFAVTTEINSIVFFVALGLGCYFVYMLGKIVYTALGLVEKSGKIITYPLTRKKKKDEKTKKMVEKLVKEKGKTKEKI